MANVLPSKCKQRKCGSGVAPTLITKGSKKEKKKNSFKDEAKKAKRDKKQKEPTWVLNDNTKLNQQTLKPSGTSCFAT
jgi:hypothetical protein